MPETMAALDPRARRAKRMRNLKLAVASSVMAKGVRFASQLIIVGVSVRYLGAENYGVWVATFAALTWLGWAQFGVGSALSNGLAEAQGRNDAAAAARLFSTGLSIILTVTLAAGLIATPIIIITMGERQIGSLTAGQSMTLAFVCLTLVLVRLPCKVIEDAYIGVQLFHVLRLWHIAGQALALGALAVLVAAGASLPWFVLGVAGASDIAVVAAGFYLVWRLRPDLRPARRRVDRASTSDLLATGSGYLVIAVSGWVITQGGVLILAWLHGPTAVTTYAVLWQLCQIANGLWMLFVTGLRGGIGEARAAADWAWLKPTLRRLIAGTMAASILFSAALAIAGPSVIVLWVGPEAAPSHALIGAMAVYYIVFAWTNIHIQLLCALKLVWSQGAATVASGVLSVAFAFLFIPAFGGTGLVGALTLALLLSSAWMLPRILRKFLREAPHGLPA